MLKVFNKKMYHLLFGDEGFAMVLTLIIWPVLLIMTGGVFVYGEIARQTIHMQNAADAASYAGATVQADALSRTAVLNKVLAWSYVQANKLEMDYVFNDFLVRSVNELDNAKESAKVANLSSLCTHPKHRSERIVDQNLIVPGQTNPVDNGYGYFAGYEFGGSYKASNILANNNKLVVTVNNDVKTVSDNVYSISTSNGKFVDVKESLDDAYTNISVINEELAALKNNLSTRINNVMTSVLTSWGISNDAATFSTTNTDSILKYSTNENKLLSILGQENIFNNSAWWSLDVSNGIRRKYDSEKNLQTTFSSGHVLWIPNSNGTCVASASTNFTHYVYGQDAYANVVDNKKCGAFPIEFNDEGSSDSSLLADKLKIKVNLNCNINFLIGSDNFNIADFIKAPAALFNVSFPNAFTYKCKSVARACPKGVNSYTVKMPTGLVNQTDWKAVWLSEEEGQL